MEGKLRETEVVKNQRERVEEREREREGGVNGVKRKMKTHTTKCCCCVKTER